MTFQDIVLDTIRREGLLAGGETVIAACSGGADSVALLGVLKELEAELGIEVRAAHINHCLRGPEAEADEAHVQALCEALAVPLDCSRLDPDRIRRGGNLEEVARRARYDDLARLAAPRGAVLATGHTLNDQAETFLMKLCRGAGPGGLSGIAIRRSHADPDRALSVRVIRPMLRASRREVLAYLEDRGLAYRTDCTNLDTRFDRNWVRQELIPVLEKRLNPRLIEVLGRTAVLFRDLDDLIEDETRRRLGDFPAGATELRISVEVLAGLPLVLRKSAIRLAYCHLEGHLTDLTQAHVQAALDLLEGTSGRRVDLPGSVVAQREFGFLRIGPPSEDLEFCYRIDWPGECPIPEVGKRVRILEPLASGHGWPVPSGEPLVVRNRRPGDRYRLTARSREKSLKRILIEQRVPVSRRSRLLIFECRGRILWVESLPPPEIVDMPGPGERLCEIHIETFAAP